MIIDKELKFTPGYSNGKDIKYTDHFSMLISFKGIPLKGRQINVIHKESIWNTKKEGGWKKYLMKTNDNKVFKRICKDIETLDPDEADKKFQAEMKRVQFAAFGKVKVSDNVKPNKDLLKMQQKKESLLAVSNIDNSKLEEKIAAVDNDIVKEVEKDQKEQKKREMERLDKILKCKGSAAKVFELKNQIVGNKKPTQEPTVIKDPKTGALVTEPAKIKETVGMFDGSFFDIVSKNFGNFSQYP